MITSKADCSCLISVLYNGEKANLKINSYKVLRDPSQCTILKKNTEEQTEKPFITYAIYGTTGLCPGANS